MARQHGKNYQLSSFTDCHRKGLLSLFFDLMVFRSWLPHISATQPPHAICSVQTQTQLTVMVCSLVPKQFPPPVFDSLLQAIKD